MAKRLIDADALRKEHCEGCNPEVIRSCENNPLCASMMWIAEAPTVDAVEVVHGRWKPDLYHDGQPYRDEWYGYIFKCSVCGGTTMGDYDLECHDNYCPNCGADMRERKEK